MSYFDGKRSYSPTDARETQSRARAGVTRFASLAAGRKVAVEWVVPGSMVTFIRIWATVAALMVAGCSSHPPPRARGRIVVAMTMDWEGAEIDADALAALAKFRAGLGDAPMTFFVSAAYFTKATPDPAVIGTLKSVVRPTDELAVHLHAWQSLAKASGIEPKLSPSFLTGTDELLQFPDGDVGFDTDLDAYDVVSLRAMLRTTRRLLEQTHLPVSKSFRAGGYLGTPKVLQAIHDEGFTVDSSATDPREILVDGAEFLSKRLQAVWPKVVTTTQPYVIHAPSGDVLEMPIAAIADYTTPAKIVGVFDALDAQLRAAPDRDVFVVLVFHLETATDYADHVAAALATVRAHGRRADELSFVTMQQAAERARIASAPVAAGGS